MPDAFVSDLTRTARDAAYVTVGLGVLAIQRAQVGRRELHRRLGDPRGDLRARMGRAAAEAGSRLGPVVTEAGSRLGPVVTEAGSRLGPVVEAIEAGLDEAEGRLPIPAGQVIHQWRAMARGAGARLRPPAT